MKTIYVWAILLVSVPAFAEEDCRVAGACMSQRSAETEDAAKGEQSQVQVPCCDNFAPPPAAQGDQTKKPADATATQ